MRFLAHKQAINFVASISPSAVTIQRMEVSPRFLRALQEIMTPEDWTVFEKLIELPGAQMYVDRISVAAQDDTPVLGWVFRFPNPDKVGTTPATTVVLGIQSPEAKERWLYKRSKETNWRYYTDQNKALGHFSFRIDVWGVEVEGFPFDRFGITDHHLNAVRMSLSCPDVHVFRYSQPHDHRPLGYLIRGKAGPESSPAIAVKTNLVVGKVRDRTRYYARESGADVPLPSIVVPEEAPKPAWQVRVLTGDQRYLLQSISKNEVITAEEVLAAIGMGGK